MKIKGGNWAIDTSQVVECLKKRGFKKSRTARFDYAPPNPAAVSRRNSHNHA